MNRVTTEQLPRDRARVVEADFNHEHDKEELESVWSRNFGDHGLHRCDLYTHDPDGRGSAWLLRASSGEAVGATGLVNRKFKLGSSVRMIGQAINLAVDAPYRTAGPALQLQRAVVGSLSAHRLPLVLGVTVMAEAVQKRVGYRVVGQATRWTKILHSAGRLRRHVTVPAVATAVGALADLGLRAVSRESWLHPRDRRESRMTAHFDERFDRLWESASGERLDRRPGDFALVGARTAECLKWRFDNAESPIRTFCLLDDEVLHGYVAFHLEHGCVHVDDLFFDDASTLEPLLAAFVQRMRTDKEAPETITIPFFGASFVTKAFARFGFWQRPFAPKVLVDALPDAAVDVDLFDPESWYLTGMDLEL